MQKAYTLYRIALFKTNNDAQEEIGCNQLMQAETLERAR